VSRKKKFRCSWEILRLQVYKKVLGAFSQFMRPKTNRFAVKFRRILEVSPCRLCEKFWAHIIDFCIQKCKAVCCSLQMPFGSFRPMRFMKKVLDAFSRFMRPKTKLFSVKFRRILEVIRLQRFAEKVLGAISQFIHSKTKLFPVKFRRIFEVICLQRSQKKFWAQFHNLCVQKRSCFP